jgi:hypothetical protein
MATLRPPRHWRRPFTKLPMQLTISRQYPTRCIGHARWDAIPEVDKLGRCPHSKWMTLSPIIMLLWRCHHIICYRMTLSSAQVPLVPWSPSCYNISMLLQYHHFGWSSPKVSRTMIPPRKMDSLEKSCSMTGVHVHVGTCNTKQDEINWQEDVFIEPIHERVVLCLVGHSRQTNRSASDPRVAIVALLWPLTTAMAAAPIRNEWPE